MILFSVEIKFPLDFKHCKNGIYRLSLTIFSMYGKISMIGSINLYRFVIKLLNARTHIIRILIRLKKIINSFFSFRASSHHSGLSWSRPSSLPRSHRRSSRRLSEDSLQRRTAIRVADDRRHSEDFFRTPFDVADNRRHSENFFRTLFDVADNRYSEFF